jgi:hypothetical protein
MNLIIERKSFISNFLSPISKITDSGILSVSNEGLQCVSCSSYDKKEQTIILFCKYKKDYSEVSDELNLNIPNITKLINVFSFLSEDEINLNVEKNNINYKSTKSGVSFKYHLLEDNVLEKPTVKMENVYKMGFDFETSLDGDKIKMFLKGSSFADKTNKTYLYTKDNFLYAILTDDDLKNIDNIEFKLSDFYVGEDIKNKIPMSLEIYRVISSLNFNELKLKINTNKGIIMFEIEKENFLLQYIVTSLVK